MPAGRRVAAAASPPMPAPMIAIDGDVRCILLGFGESGFSAGYPAEDSHSRQAVQGESTGRFAAAIQSGYDLALHVDDLALAIDPQTSQAIVKYGRGPGGIERRLLDFVFRIRVSKIRVLAHVHIGVVLGHSFFERAGGHGLKL